MSRDKRICEQPDTGGNRRIWTLVTSEKSPAHCRIFERNRISSGGETGLPELSLTGLNITVKDVTSGLYSVRVHCVLRYSKMRLVLTTLTKRGRWLPKGLFSSQNEPGLILSIGALTAKLLTRVNLEQSRRKQHVQPSVTCVVIQWRGGRSLTLLQLC
ncbi:hypothetical protein EVAR_87385_1 [Eumeta japonica]|uniref:Uncharacterized protein n=1 Tax=Eumeta variegata TaxID=151549 RepID=A0A4C1Y3X4_EUMVA|nr:hypothetical protein EVAR_87385_1 [Eumeta japonica]